VAFCLALCVAATCRAGGAWQPVGPSGGDQFLVQIAPSDPRTLYALGHYSIHVSTNRGCSWRAIHDSSMNEGDFLGIAFPSNDTSTILASRTGGGLFQTHNGGKSWGDLTNGLPLAGSDPGELVTISSMATFPDRTVVAGVTSRDYPASWAYSLAPTATTWTAQGQGLDVVVPRPFLGNVPAVLLSLDAANNMWAVLDGGGVFSWNANQWESRFANLPSKAVARPSWLMT